MSSREKLIELLKEKGIDNAEYITNYLIANGVVIQEDGWWTHPTPYGPFYCSVCNCVEDKPLKYCPNCGANMRIGRR